MASARYQKTEKSSSEDMKRQLGAYYTPESLSDVLCQWAIRQPSDFILEPSFGGCGFLKSAAERLKALGKGLTQTQLYGCDIDPEAFQYLSNKVGGLVDTSHFVRGNFLSFNKPHSWPESFNAIVGNPPYLPYQSIPLDKRNAAIKKLKAIKFNIGLQSSSWVYFVALSLSFLGQGGRIAWVLPGSFLQANYAKRLREYLNANFLRVRAFQIRERLFLYEGTDEQTVVLLADGYNRSYTSNLEDIKLSVCDNISELPKLVQEWDQGEVSSGSLCSTSIFDAMNNDEQELFEHLDSTMQCKSLGDFADARIGLVTGDNRFFVISHKKALELGISKRALKPILSKFSSALGVQFLDSDHSEDLLSNKNCLLVSADSMNCRSPNLAKYLRNFYNITGKRRGDVSTFKKKPVWCKIDDGNPPDAFFPVMHHDGPRLVLNSAGINCTNTVHRIYFKGSTKTTGQKLIAISLLSTFSQISAEIVGRKYGSGVLKHEPREVEKIRILLPKYTDWRAVDAEYKAIDKLLRSGEIDSARQRSDKFVLSSLINDDLLNVEKTLNGGLERLRELRYANRSK